MRNDSSISIIAANGYWGEPTTTEFYAGQVNLSRIYDSHDSSSVGQVQIQSIRGFSVESVPRFTLQPQSQSVNLGDTVTLSPMVSGAPTITYQWFFNNIALPQAKSLTLTLGNVTAAAGGTYYLVASNANGSATSAVAYVAIVQQTVVTNITQQPQSQTVLVGGTASFTVVVTGLEPLTYQWKKNNSAIPGATSATFSIAYALVSDTAEYCVTVSNSTGSVTSQPATLTVNLIAGTTIARQIARSGTTYTVTIMVAPPTGTPAYLVEEIVPTGFVVGNISNLGVMDAPNSRVTWGPFWDGMPRTLVYTMESPAGFSGTVALNGRALFYGATASTAGDTTITVSPPLVPARLEMGEFFGYYTVSIFGEVGGTYVLEASDDMQDPWEVIGTLKLNTSPRVYVDLESPTRTQRFYRAKWVK